MKKKEKVFLGGTCNESTWRDDLIKMLNIDFFNPVVDEWNDEAYKQELYERENCDYCLYVITPKMTGVYSIAEVIDDSNKRPSKTIFCFIAKDGSADFSEAQIKSLNAVGKMVQKNGGFWALTLNQVAAYLNSDNMLTNKKVKNWRPDF